MYCFTTGRHQNLKVTKQYIKNLTQQKISTVLHTSPRTLSLNFLILHNIVALHTVFQCTALAKLTYATPAWWRFTNVSDRNRLAVFLCWMTKFGYYSQHSPSFASLCDQADKRFFFTVCYNNIHPLDCLLPPNVIKTYKTCPRGRSFQLPSKTTNECNLLYRMVCKCI